MTVGLGVTVGTVVAVGGGGSAEKEGAAVTVRAVASVAVMRRFFGMTNSPEVAVGGFATHVT